MEFILVRKAEKEQKQITKNIILYTGKDYEEKHHKKTVRMAKEGPLWR